MPGPWEQYQQPAAAQGPWAKYGTAAPAPEEKLPEGVTKDYEGRLGPTPEPSTLDLYKQALFNPVGSGAKQQGVPGGLEQIGGKAMETMLSPVIHPTETLKSVKNVMQASPLLPFYEPTGTATNPLSGIAQEWKTNKPLAAENALGTALGTFEGGRMIPAGVNAIPSRARASRVLGEIGSEAANVPVSMARTAPALEGFGQHVATGGRNAAVMGKLGSRMESGEPILFPEARNFYTNVTDVTKPPSVLGRWLENARAPRLRYAAGPVRQGLNEDLTQAAGTIGRGEDYQRAMNEYANAMRMQSYLRKAAIPAASAAAGALGAGRLYGYGTSLFGGR